MLEYFILFTALALSICCYLLSKFCYWRRKGVPGPKPTPLFGNFAGVFLGLTSTHETFIELYKYGKRYPFFGAYRGHAPVLIINDLDLIKRILIKDFSVFSGRGIAINEDVDPFQAHLFNLDGLRWKYLRTKLTPIFTTGKIKHMFELMLECADHFEIYLRREFAKNEVVEFREAAAKFTTDVIGCCAFGINMDALDSENSKFRDAGRRIFESNYFTTLKRIFREVTPKLFRLCKISMTPKRTAKLFTASIRETMRCRRREKFIKNDLIDTLIEIQSTHDSSEFEITEGLLAAQAYVFFAAGFETSSTTISFALYELAHAQEVQEVLIAEISETLKNNGELSYKVLNKMRYLDMVVQETLRKNPPATFLQRKASQPYTIPGSSVSLERGAKVVIPVYAIHHDPEYYPDPEVFDPERFSEEAKRMRHPMVHLPFGGGPKNCIGARFALYQVKLGLVKVLKNYRIRPTEFTPYPYKIDRGNIVLAPVHGVHLKLEPILYVTNLD